MAKKTKRKTTKNTKKKVSAARKIAMGQIEYLKTLIKFDERNMDGSGDSLDQLFTEQRGRKLEQIATLKAVK